MSEMTPALWQRVTAVLDKVLHHDSGEREALLGDLCDGNEELRREVESLLGYEEASASLLEEPIVSRPERPANGTGEETAGAVTAAPTEIGLRIGPYKLLERLGAGGMGDVFLAERQDGFRKLVALKRIQAGKLAEDEKLAEELRYRFETERQILADLEHPNIARILDGGTTADGLPYFAMEYVQGQPIDRYCDQRRLPIRERLRLFLDVCAALQLAHQNLVVHRDLKPRNILVTEQGVAKLLDFGIAKLLSPGSKADPTRFGDQPMTLRYAAPEQLQSQPITTATDVYALGVLLFQLLSGHDPYRYDQGTLKLHRAICEQTPPKPSDAVAGTVEVRAKKGRELRTPESVSGPRGTHPEMLKRQLAGDLDSIVLKALRKRPENRYQSMEQLAADIRRHLDGLPVTAHEGTLRYRAGKFVRRNRLRLAVASVMLLVLAVSGGAVMMAWRQATETRIRATERTSNLLRGLLDALDPNGTGNRIIPLEFLDNARQEITKDLRDDPELLAELLDDPLAEIYGRLAHHEQAIAARSEALTILRARNPGDHEKTAEVLQNLGASLYRTGRYEEAEQCWREVIEMRERLGMGDAELVTPLSNLATNLARQGKVDEASEQYQRVLEIQRQRFGSDDSALALPLRNLAMLRYNQAELVGAEALVRQALKIELAAFGPVSVGVASARSSLGRILLARGELEQAESELLQALDARRQLFDPDHEGIAFVERNLAAVLLEAGAPGTAEVLLARAQVALRSRLPADDWQIQELESLMGAVFLERRLFEAAEPCLVDSYRALEKTRGSEAIYTKQALERLIRLYEAWEKPMQADEYRQMLEASSK